MLILSVPAAAAAQADFNSFFAEFKVAALRGDKAAVKNAMSDRFEWALDGVVPKAEAWKYFNGDARHWSDLKKSVMRTPRRCESVFANRKGYCIDTGKRATYGLMFAEVNGRWRFYALLGD